MRAAPNVDAPGEVGTKCRAQGTADGADFRSRGSSAQAALTIEGEEYAQAWLDRLAEGTAQPGELAVIVGFLQGPMLLGACRLIEKSMGGRHA